MKLRKSIAKRARSYTIFKRKMVAEKKKMAAKEKAFMSSSKSLKILKAIAE